MSKAPRDPGFFGWLGRQVGHVKKAATTPARPAKSPPSAPRQPSPPRSTAAHNPASPARPNPATAAPPPAENQPAVLYRKGKVEERPMPDQPGIILRRTTIDEVVVDPDAAPPKRDLNEDARR